MTEKEKREERKRNGLCPRCGHKVDRDGTYCKSCIEKTNKLRKDFVENRKKKGLCVKCGKPLDRDGILCVECNDKRNKETKENRDYYKKNGICPRCGQEVLFGSEKNCIICREKAYKLSMENRTKNGIDHYNEIHREWAQNAYWKRIANGICTRCGKRKADGGCSTCGICRAKQYKQRKAREIKKGIVKIPLDERWLHGLCYFCDEHVKHGYKVCEKHYAMNIKKFKCEEVIENREKKKKENSLFFMSGNNNCEPSIEA